MPKIQVNGANLFYEDSGGDDKEVIVFSHGLLAGTRKNCWVAPYDDS